MKEKFSMISSKNSVLSSWVAMGGLFVNDFFFKRGLVLLAPQAENDQVSEKNAQFTFNERTLVFHHPEVENASKKPNERILKKSKALLTQLSDFVKKNQKANVVTTNASVLFNSKRREEIFFPLTFKQSEKFCGSYIYPWVSKTPFKSFTGFQRFVTAGCMFGANLKGITQDGDEVTLINHQLQLRPQQKIHSISYDAQESPFEDVLFEEFEKHCLFIQNFSASAQKKELLYHLPYTDYILFGVKLFLQQKITDNALYQLIHSILGKKEEYHQKLNTICKNYDIHLRIESPFDPLVTHFSQEQTAEDILKQLPLTETSSETQFVSDCLKFLAPQTCDSDMSFCWKTLLGVQNEPIDDIESLFRLANAVMLAKAAHQTQPYQVCSLLPLSEKQIQVQYLKLSEQLSLSFPEKAAEFPPVFNITTLDPVITYSANTKGLLFYFACHLPQLAELLKKENLVAKAASNLHFFPQALDNQNNLSQTPSSKTTNKKTF